MRRPMIAGDVKAGSWRHLLQILYSLRVARLSPATVETSGLREALERVVAEGSSSVAEEATLLLARLGPKKRGGAKEAAEGRQTAEKSLEVPLLSDEVTYELPHWEEETKRVEIRLPINHWGIKYHVKDAVL